MLPLHLQVGLSSYFINMSNYGTPLGYQVLIIASANIRIDSTPVKPLSLCSQLDSIRVISKQGRAKVLEVDGHHVSKSGSRVRLSDEVAMPLVKQYTDVPILNQYIQLPSLPSLPNMTAPRQLYRHYSLIPILQHLPPHLLIHLCKWRPWCTNMGLQWTWQLGCGLGSRYRVRDTG
jgi:hypothetical protein